MRLIEFAGMPNCGKSSSIQVVRNRILGKKFSVQIIDEPFRSCTLSYNSDHPNFRIALTSWNANQTLCKILEAKIGIALFNYTLLDRGLFDVLAFIKFIYLEGFISNSEFGRLIDYFTIPIWTGLIDLVLFLEITPEESLARDFSTQLGLPAGKVRNPESLKRLSSSYEYIYDNYGALFPLICRIDVSKYSRKEAVLQVLEKLGSTIPELSY
jgi:hypothetical protein